MDNFLANKKDTLALNIQHNCEVLHRKMSDLQVANIGLSDHGRHYYSGSHLKRIFFSIQTSAHILYNSIKLINKPVSEIVLMDYGAGVGSLYILAKMIGCKQVIYNDILEEWKNNALLIASAININVDEYIVGDIENTLKLLSLKQIFCDIITSRNVVEHIHDLQAFYDATNFYQPNAIVYSSTTANFYNPAMLLQHIVLHSKVSKLHDAQRYDLIRELAPKVPTNTINLLVRLTKGYQKEAIQKAINQYVTKGLKPVPKNYFTNTCEINYGVWAENILPFFIYRAALRETSYQIDFLPGFWDTHYRNKWKNIIGKVCNPIITLNKWLGFVLAPFIYVIVLPKNPTTNVA